MLPILGNGRAVLDQENGYFVSDKAARLAVMLAEFDDTLHLQYIPENDRGPADKAQPFRIMQDAPGHAPYVVMYLREDQVDHRVIAKLAHMREYGMNGGESLSSLLDYEEAAERRWREKELEEAREEAKDKARFLIRTPLHTVNFEGKKLHL